MTFQTKKLRSDKKLSEFKKKLLQNTQHPEGNKKNKLYFIFFLSFILVFGSLSVLWGIITLAKDFKPTDLIPSFLTKEIRTDTNNHTNVLILGVGGENHDGGNLTDTIIIASLDHDNKYTAMLSLPRDLWIKTDVGNSRINNIYEFAKEKHGNSSAGLEYLRGTIEQTLHIPIHYYIKIDFQAAIDAVNAVGGVDIYLDKPFYDPLYPKEGTIQYETFSLPAGNVHLNGEKALKYMRSRHSTSDFDRSSRQQQIISTVKEKALSMDILSNPGKLKKLFLTLQNNIETNLEWKEILYLGKISEKFSTENLTRAVISDNPVAVGGFLYTPEREYYGGAYVLIPHTNDFSELQDLANHILLDPLSFVQQTPIQLLNISGIGGLATNTKRMLTRHGFNIVRFGNGYSQNIPTTKIYYKNPNNKPTMIDSLLTLIPAEISTEIPTQYLKDPYLSEAEIIIELGKDYSEYLKTNPNRFTY